MGLSITSARGPAHLLNNLERHNNGIQRAVERLSTGKRINRPSDDPSGFVAAEELRGELDRLNGELKGVAAQRIAARQQQSTLQRVQTQLNNLKSAVEGSLSGPLSDAERTAYRQEIDASLDAIALLQGGKAADALAGQVTHQLASQAKANLTPSDRPINLEAAATAADAAADQAIFSQAALAAYEKYNLQVREDLATNMIETHTAALSQIEDADFAEETANLIMSQTLASGALAAIAFSGHVNADQITGLIEAIAPEEAASPPPSAAGR